MTTVLEINELFKYLLNTTVLEINDLFQYFMGTTWEEFYK